MDDLFGSALADEGPRAGKHANRTEMLMRRLAEKGATLEHLASPRMMNRSLRTLQEHARTYEISFPDYVPMKLRAKKAKAGKVSQDA